MGLTTTFMGLITPFMGLIAPFMELINAFLGLINPITGFINPFMGLISPFMGLISGSGPSSSHRLHDLVAKALPYAPEVHPEDARYAPPGWQRDRPSGRSGPAESMNSSDTDM